MFTTRFKAIAMLGALLAAGCNNNPPAAPPPSPVAPLTISPPAVSPPSVVQQPTVQQPTVQQPPVQTSVPATNPSSVPPAAVNNAQPDLVVFGMLWSPKGPYDVDFAAADRPKLAAAANDALITKVLSDLEVAANDAALQEQALVELQRANRTQQRRTEVSQRLEPLLSSPAQRVQMLATQSCATWGTEANIASLKKLAQLDDPHVSNDAVWAIYCTTDVSQAAPFLALPICYHGAQKAFRQARSGEEHVWPLLSSPDPTTVFHALGALMHVATPQSVSHMVALKQHPDVLVSRQSQAVVNEIQRRQK